MDFGSKFGGWEHLLLYSVAGAVFVLLLLGLAKLVRWAKGMPDEAYLNIGVISYDFAIFDATSGNKKVTTY